MIVRPSVAKDFSNTLCRLIACSHSAAETFQTLGLLRRIAIRLRYRSALYDDGFLRRRRPVQGYKAGLQDIGQPDRLPGSAPQPTDSLIVVAVPISSAALAALKIFPFWMLTTLTSALRLPQADFCSAT